MILIIRLVVDVRQSYLTTAMLGVVNARLLRVLPLTDGVRREDNNPFIATVILQTSTNVDQTIAIHVTVSRWDPVRIPILFQSSRIQSKSTPYSYIK